MASWKITLKLPQELIPPVTEIIAGLDPDDFPTLSDFEITPEGKKRQLDVFFTIKPDLALLRRRLGPILSPATLSSHDIALLEVIEKDWVSESQKLLHPVDTGLFFIYGAHNSDRISDDRINLLVEAGQAFGTGRHETTYGCLVAIEDLARDFRNGNTPQTALDLGCGSGLLALAMSKIWPTSSIVACDIDPVATATTRQNAIANHVAIANPGEKGLAIVTGDGFENNGLGLSSPYDVIVANILAGPLRDMATDIVAHLSARGSLILSGLLATQEDMISESYHPLGMTVINRYPNGEWTSLLLRRIRVRP